MSLTVALRTALSSLQATQSQFQVASSNIANVNTVGYTRKTLAVNSVVLDGNGAGVRTGTVQRSVDAFLVRQVRDMASSTSQFTVYDRYLQTIQDQFGTPADNTSISGSISSFSTALQALATQPETVARASEAVGQAKLLADQINALADSMQQMRAEADVEINRVIGEVNGALDEIAHLNVLIVRANALNQPTGDLQDQRDNLVRKIAEHMDVRSYERSNGDMVLMTGSGRRLVDGDQATPLSHDPFTSLGANATYLPTTTTGFYNTGGVNGIYLGTPADTTNGTNDITSEIASGRLKALIDQRDDVLSGMQSSLDELASKMRDAVNAGHNNGAAFPPPATLTGTQTVAGTDPISGAGIFRIALVNPTTGAISNVADINLAGLTTVNQVITAINGAAGLGGNVTASLVGGKLQLATSNGSGIVINENTSAIATGADTRGLSHFFGLNDLYVAGTDYASWDSNVQTDANAALGLTGPLSFSYGGTTTNIAVAATDSLADVATAINANAALTAAGIQASLVADASGYRLHLVDGGGENFFLSSAGTAVSGLGMGVHRVGSANEIEVRSAIVNNPNLLSRGDVAMTDVVGNIAIGTGDSTAAQAMADVFSSSFAWAANGNGLPSMNATLAGFANQLLSSAASQASSAKDQLEFSTSLLNQLDTRLQNDSGVDLDEELANLTILQNAYGAAARVVSVASEMFDELGNIMR